MIILLDTSTPTCRLSLRISNETETVEWEAGRTLADGLLGFLKRELAKRKAGWNDITGIGVFRGPGSFTGLRISLTVMNTIADAKQIPIVGAEGDDWHEQALKRLDNGENDTMILPLYGRDANITMPRK